VNESLEPSNRFDDIIDELQATRDGRRLSSFEALAVGQRLEAMLASDPQLSVEYNPGTIEPDQGRYGRAAANAVQFTHTVARITLPLIQKAAVASGKAFLTGVTEMRRSLDRGGTFDLHQTEQMLSKTQGEGSGTFTDKSLAHQLEIDGEIPDDYVAVLQQALQVSEAIVNNVVAQSNNAMSKVHAAITVSDSNMDFKALGDTLAKVAKILTDEPRLSAILDTKATKFTWPGGLAMAQPRPAKKMHLKFSTTNANAGELLDRLQKDSLDITVKPRPRKDVNLVGMNVLPRHSAEAVLDATVHLINFNSKLLDIASGKDISKFDPKLSVSSYDAILGHLIDVAIENERKTSPKVKMPEDLEALDLIVIAYLKHFQYLNGRKVIAGLFNRNLAAIRAGLSYVRASAKHYK